MIEIPKQLRQPQFRFCLLKPKDKIPFEDDWQKTRNYRYDSPILLAHLNSNGNYGVVCGYGNLRVLDIDNPELAKTILANFQSTFAVKTGRGGAHFYFISDLDENHVLSDKAGELRCKNYQVVGANCIHPNGNKYLIQNDLNIEEISPEIIKGILKDYIREQKPYTLTTKVDDETRSGREFKYIIKLIRQSWTKDKIFNEMQMFSKWCEAHPAYRELTYAKAEKFVKDENLYKTSDIFVRRKQAEKFCEMQPVYYDTAGIWWIWDKAEFKWCMGDDTDICNLAFENSKLDCIETKVRNEVLQALMQVSRKHKPKDVPKHWLQFKDKVVDVKTGMVFDATPEFFITNPIPHKLGQSMDTPEMDKLFAEWIVGEGQDESYVKVLYEIMAYAACSEQFLQTIAALTGSGSNGKGTFLKLLTKFIGVDNTCSSNLKALSKRNFETSALYKKLFCNIGEVDYEDLQNTSVIKQLTGEDLIRYEFKGRNMFSDYSPTTLIVATNSLPKTPDTSIGFYRRWLILDFPNQFGVKADVLARIPDAEYENLAFKTCSILKELYERGSFSNAQSFEEKQKRYEEHSNPIQKFIDERCEDIAGQNTVLRDFVNELNIYLKEKHLRSMTIKTTGKILRDDGWIVANRHIGDGDQEYAAVVILNLIIKPKLL